MVCHDSEKSGAEEDGSAEAVALGRDAEVVAQRGDVEVEGAERVANNILSSAVTI